MPEYEPQHDPNQTLVAPAHLKALWAGQGSVHDTLRIDDAPTVEIKVPDIRSNPEAMRWYTGSKLETTAGAATSLAGAEVVPVVDRELPSSGSMGDVDLLSRPHRIKVVDGVLTAVPEGTRDELDTPVNSTLTTVPGETPRLQVEESASEPDAKTGSEGVEKEAAQSQVIGYGSEHVSGAVIGELSEAKSDVLTTSGVAVNDLQGQDGSEVVRIETVHPASPEVSNLEAASEVSAKKPTIADELKPSERVLPPADEVQKPLKRPSPTAEETSLSLGPEGRRNDENYLNMLRDELATWHGLNDMQRKAKAESMLDPSRRLPESVRHIYEAVAIGATEDPHLVNGVYGNSLRRHMATALNGLDSAVYARVMKNLDSYMGTYYERLARLRSHARPSEEKLNIKDGLYDYLNRLVDNNGIEGEGKKIIAALSAGLMAGRPERSLAEIDKVRTMLLAESE